MGLVSGVVMGLPATEFAQRVIEIVDGHFRGVDRVIDAASGVDQFALGIENEEMRRAQGAVGQRGRLAFVAQVGPGEVLFLHRADHQFERVFRMHQYGIGVDADKDDALLFEFLGGLPRHRIRAGDEGAMIAGEKHHQHTRAGKVGQGITFPVGGGKTKIRSRGPEG